MESRNIFCVLTVIAAAIIHMDASHTVCQDLGAICFLIINEQRIHLIFTAALRGGASRICTPLMRAAMLREASPIYRGHNKTQSRALWRPTVLLPSRSGRRCCRGGALPPEVGLHHVSRLPEWLGLPGCSICVPPTTSVNLPFLPPPGLSLLPPPPPQHTHTLWRPQWRSQPCLGLRALPGEQRHPLLVAPNHGPSSGCAEPLAPCAQAWSMSFEEEMRLRPKGVVLTP